MNPGSNPPRVVACLPAWNAESFIDHTLESLAAQTYPSLEIVISDDASTDLTAALCARFAAAHRNSRLIRQPQRQGWIGNVNALLREVQGKYCFFAFHDDPLKPSYVAKLVDALEGHPNAVLAHTDIEVGSRVASYSELEGISDRLERARRLIRKQGLWWIPNRGLFRAEAARQIGGMRRHFAGEYSADWPWLLHMALLGEFVRVPEPLVRKVFRDEGLTRVWGRNLWQSIAVLLACGREVRRASLPLSEQIQMHWELAKLGARGLVGRIGEAAR